MYHHQTLVIMPSKLKHKRHGEGFHGYAFLAPKPRRKFTQAPGGRVCSLIIIKPVIIQGPRPICCSWATRKPDDPDVSPYQTFVQSDREDLEEEEEEEEVDGRRFGLSYIPVWLGSWWSCDLRFLKRGNLSRGILFFFCFFFR